MIENINLRETNVFGASMTLRRHITYMSHVLYIKRVNDNNVEETSTNQRRYRATPLQSCRSLAHRI